MFYFNQLENNYTFRAYSRPILQLSNVAPSYKNYAKLYFDTKHFEKGLNRGGVETFGALFFKKKPFCQKKVPSLANIECCPKFLEYPLALMVFVTAQKIY